MSDKTFNIRKYRGKDRYLVAVPRTTGVMRLWVWNHEKERYEPPSRGKAFLARKQIQGCDGKIKREGKAFETLQEARAWLHSRQVSAVPNVSPSSITRLELHGPTFSEVVEGWRQARWASFADSTKIFYEGKLKAFQPLLDVRIEDFNPQLMDDFLGFLKSPEQMMKGKLSRLSFEKELELLNTIIRWYKDNYDDAKLGIPLRKRHWEAAFVRERPEVKPMVMLPEEKEAFLMKIREQSQMLYVFASIQISQILRISEVAGMKYSNLDAENLSYRINEHVVWLRKAQSRPKLKPGMKNLKRVSSTIPLRKWTAELIRTLPKSSGTDLLFHRDGLLLTYKDIYHSYNRASKAAGLPFTGTHILRHTGATEFLDETGDPLALMEMGNWATIDMAMHYGRIRKDRAARAVREADRKLESSGSAESRIGGNKW